MQGPVVEQVVRAERGSLDVVFDGDRGSEVVFERAAELQLGDAEVDRVGHPTGEGVNGPGNAHPNRGEAVGRHTELLRCPFGGVHRAGDHRFLSEPRGQTELSPDNPVVFVHNDGVDLGATDVEPEAH